MTATTVLCQPWCDPVWCSAADRSTLTNIPTHHSAPTPVRDGHTQVTSWLLAGVGGEPVLALSVALLGLPGPTGYLRVPAASRWVAGVSGLLRAAS